MRRPPSPRTPPARGRRRAGLLVLLRDRELLRGLLRRLRRLGGLRLHRRHLGVRRRLLLARGDDGGGVLLQLRLHVVRLVELLLLLLGLSLLLVLGLLLLLLLLGLLEELLLKLLL